MLPSIYLAKLASVASSLVVVLVTHGQFISLACAADQAADKLYFETDVRPIFKAMCFSCHGEAQDELAGGLDVRLVRLLKEGGDSGAALAEGDVPASLLWQRIEQDEMPEGAKKLSAAQKATIRAWIEAGSPTLRNEPANVEDARYTQEELNHWAFQAVQPVPIPHADGATLNTPIDAFVAARLHEAGLSQSPEEDRVNLLRRVTFDLTGLPPTSAEVDAFVSDDSPTAYETVVDRLLASSAFGVRWGRHWLDIAGYSETEGNLADDVARPNAWRYREYVIDSINADKPYDLFLQEQLAGDELLHLDGSIDANNPRHVELLSATGFLRMAPDLTAKSNALNDRNQVVSETIKIVSSATIGLSIGCAQCHDHRYDPVSIEDYYQLRAIFDPAFAIQSWRTPDQRVVDVTTHETQVEIERIEAIAVEQEANLQQQRLELGKVIYERLINELPEDEREKIVAATAKVPQQRAADETELLERFPMFKPAEEIAIRLAVYDSSAHNRFFEEEQKIKQLRESGPDRRLIACVAESEGAPPQRTVFSRGDPMSPGAQVAPAEVFVLARGRSLEMIAADDPGLPTSGRRLAYARQLTDGSHPTVARVAVNRIWAHHFGKGIVATPSDFGLNSDRPSHPSLLDWLADDFVHSGWRMKRLHKMMVMSHTYRQSSLQTPQADAVDHDNRLLSRMNLRRLEAEEIRDAILAVSGLLNHRSSGPSVPIATHPDGRVVIGKSILNNGGLFDHIDDAGDEQYRRSMFISAQRIAPLTMLATFDAPAMLPNCDIRTVSTVAPQSLWFLNDESSIEASRATVRELSQSELGASAEPSTEFAPAQLKNLWRRIYSVEPTAEELASCTAFVADQSRFLAEAKEAPESAALVSLCQALLSTNRFLYVE